MPDDQIQRPAVTRPRAWVKKVVAVRSRFEAPVGLPNSKEGIDVTSLVKYPGDLNFVYSGTVEDNVSINHQATEPRRELRSASTEIRELKQRGHPLVYPVKKTVGGFEIVSR